MTHTFWHAGVRIGESKLAIPSGNAGQRVGIFHPTEYGLALLPKLCCILTVGHAFTLHLESIGRRADDLAPDELEALLTESEAGRAMIDFGRMMSEVELRGPDGKRIEVASMGFSNVEEIRRVGRALGKGVDKQLADLPSDAPHYIVSATWKSNAWSRKVKAPARH